MFSSPTPYFKSLRYGYVYLDTLVIVTIDFQGDRVQYALKPPLPLPITKNLTSFARTSQ